MLLLFRIKYEMSTRQLHNHFSHQYSKRTNHFQTSCKKIQYPNNNNMQNIPNTVKLDKFSENNEQTVPMLSFYFEN